MSTRFHTLNEFLEHVRWELDESGQKMRTGDGRYIYALSCPVHSDEINTDLKIIEVDHEIILHCCAGCKRKDILDALDLRPKDLFLDGPRFSYPIVKTISVTYECVDNEGDLACQVVCYEPKKFQLQAAGFVQEMHDIDFIAINAWLLEDWGFEIYDLDY